MRCYMAYKGQAAVGIRGATPQQAFAVTEPYDPPAGFSPSDFHEITPAEFDEWTFDVRFDTLDIRNPSEWAQ